MHFRHSTAPDLVLGLPLPVVPALQAALLDWRGSEEFDLRRRVRPVVTAGAAWDRERSGTQIIAARRGCP